MTKTDALIYAADRIRVSSVHPGFIWTPRWLDPQPRRLEPQRCLDSGQWRAPLSQAS